MCLRVGVRVSVGAKWARDENSQHIARADFGCVGIVLVAPLLP